MRDEASPPRPIRRAAGAAVGLALVLLVATAAAAGSRVCVRAEIEEPFLLPDGSLHPRGSLRICLDRAYTPVLGLHTIVAQDGMAGTFLGRREEAEGRAELGPPRIFFRRDASRTLALLGYTVSASGTTEVYWVEPPRSAAMR